MSRRENAAAIQDRICEEIFKKKEKLEMKENLDKQKISISIY